MMPSLISSAQLGKYYAKMRRENIRTPNGMRKQTSDQSDEILPIKEVAASLKVGKRAVCRPVAIGGLPVLKLGGTWRPRRGDLNQRIAGHIGNASVVGGGAR